MIFLDASFLIAFFVENDEKHHERAVEIAKTIKDRNKIISKLVIAETITVLKNKLQTKEIREIYYTLQEFVIVDDTSLFDKGLEQFVKYDSEISFFDAVYIVIMKELGIYEIASFDDDFDNKNSIVRIH